MAFLPIAEQFPNKQQWTEIQNGSNVRQYQINGTFNNTFFSPLTIFSFAEYIILYTPSYSSIMEKYFNYIDWKWKNADSDRK